MLSTPLKSESFAAEVNVNDLTLRAVLPPRLSTWVFNAESFNLSLSTSLRKSATTLRSESVKPPIESIWVCNADIANVSESNLATNGPSL